MPKKSLNRVLAENLVAITSSRQISDKRLGELAGIAPNTVGNYMKSAREAEHQYASKTGKENSATLTNVEAIAGALGLPAALLLISEEDRAALAIEALKLATEMVSGQRADSAADKVAEAGIHPGRSEKVKKPSMQPKP